MNISLPMRVVDDGNESDRRLRLVCPRCDAVRKRLFFYVQDRGRTSWPGVACGPCLRDQSSGLSPLRIAGVIDMRNRFEKEEYRDEDQEARSRGTRPDQPAGGADDAGPASDPRATGAIG